MLRETGFCHGIENYSRHLALRGEGETPSTLMDFFGDDYLLIVDESHVTLPQVKAMYNGDRMRKQTLVDYGLDFLVHLITDHLSLMSLMLRLKRLYIYQPLLVIMSYHLLAVNLRKQLFVQLGF